MTATLMGSRAARFVVAGGLGCLLAVLSGCGGGSDAVVTAPPVAAMPATLLVGNTRGNNVVRVDRATGAYIKDFIEPGVGGLTDPDDLTFGPDGNLYVSSGTNTGGQILRYDGKTGAFLGIFAQGSGMRRPYGNAFGPDSHLHVASFRSDQILKFDGKTGAFMSVFAQGDGTAGGLFNGPNDILFGPGGTARHQTDGSGCSLNQ